MSQPIDRLSLHQISAAYAAGYKRAMTQIGRLEPFISLREAYALYGRGQVDRWEKEGLIEKIKDGPRNSRVRIDRERLDLVAQMNNRESWYENH